MEKNIQFFVDVNDKGEIMNAQMGVNIVVTDPALPFVFMIDEEQAKRISENMGNFSVEIRNFKPQLVEKEAITE